MKSNPYFKNFTKPNHTEEEYSHYIVSNFQRKKIAEIRFGIASM